MNETQIHKYTLKLKDIYSDIKRIQLLLNRQGIIKENDANNLDIYIKEIKKFRIISKESIHATYKKNACNMLSQYIYFTALFLKNKGKWVRNAGKTIFEIIPALLDTPFKRMFKDASGEVPAFYASTLTYYRNAMHQFLSLVHTTPFDPVLFELYELMLSRGVIFYTIRHKTKEEDPLAIMDYKDFLNEESIHEGTIEVNNLYRRWLDSISVAMEVKFDIFVCKLKGYIMPGTANYPDIEEFSNKCKEYIHSQINMEYHDEVISEIYGELLPDEKIYEGERIMYSIEYKMRPGKQIYGDEVLKDLRFEDFAHSLKFLKIDIPKCVDTFTLIDEEVEDDEKFYYHNLVQACFSDVAIGDGWWDSIFCKRHKLPWMLTVIDSIDTGSMVQIFGTFDFYHNHKLYYCPNVFYAIALWLLFNHKTDPLCKKIWKVIHPPRKADEKDE
jgi:hypothetical protein